MTKKKNPTKKIQQKTKKKKKRKKRKYYGELPTKKGIRVTTDKFKEIIEVIKNDIK